MNVELKFITPDAEAHIGAAAAECYDSSTEREACLRRAEHCMSVQHTPGPWEIDFGYNRIIKSIGPCFPDEYAGSAWLEVTEEDARLIAAAPDLLEALRDCLRRIDDADETYGPDHAVTKARAAIAKATGE